MLSGLVAEAKEIGFSAFEAEELVSWLAAARNVIDAKHVSYKEKPKAERSKVIQAMYRQIQEDNRWALRLTKKLDAHRKLMRYEQRAVNQLRKAARIKK